VPSIYIDGAWGSAASGRTTAIVNPFDRTIVATIDSGDDADILRAIGAARRAFDATDWPRRPPADRASLLTCVADLLVRDRDVVARTETLNTGKALRESRADVDDTVAAFRWFAGLIEREGAGGEGATGEDGRGRVVETGRPNVESRVVWEPVGVCGLISPWNYPLLQISWKVAPALAAGNTIVIKPAQITPLTTIHLVRSLEEAGVQVGLPRGVVNLVTGPGSVLGDTLARSADVDLLSFTGGMEAGRSIMKAASGNAKKLALELGGKSPNIVFADADRDAALDNALTAAFLNAGQVCSAGCRLLVEASIADDFVAEVARRAEEIRLGNGLDEGTEAGPLISEEHRAKVEGYVAIGSAEGARLVAGGRRPAEPDLQNGFFYRPTVFDRCDRDMRIVREEIFGPVLTVQRFTTEEEAIDLANDTVFGLAGAVWTSDSARAARVARGIRAGTVWINDYHPYVAGAEWGGFKQSGFGRELGLQGLEEYREAKHIYRNLSPAPSRWFGG
jgi:betaine-aldehyde dehydrogenase